MTHKEKITYVYNVYKELLDLPLNEIPQIGRNVEIPFFNQTTLFQFLDAVLESCENEKPLIRIKKPVIIVGDLHGNLHDLLRIIKINGHPSTTKYLFLGDYVDRGEFSLEVITLLLCLRTLYPKNVFLLRGNHETRETNEFYGFKTDIQYLYQEYSLWSKFNDVFDYLPLAAIIQNKIFCVHGGLSPFLTSISDIESIQFPLRSPTPLVNDLLWSDPTDYCNSYLRESERGIGCLFGKAATQKFLSANGLTSIVRGHECVSGGVASMHNHMCYTLFSSSNYELSKNIAAYLIVNEKGELEQLTLKQIKRIKRRKCRFIEIKEEEEEESFGLFDFFQFFFSFFTKKASPDFVHA